MEHLQNYSNASRLIETKLTPYIKVLAGVSIRLEHSADGGSYIFTLWKHW